MLASYFNRYIEKLSEVQKNNYSLFLRLQITNFYLLNCRNNRALSVYACNLYFHSKFPIISKQLNKIRLDIIFLYRHIPNTSWQLNLSIRFVGYYLEHVNFDRCATAEGASVCDRVCL